MFPKRLLSFLTYLALLALAGAGAYLLNNRFGYTPLLFLALLPFFDAACVLRARFCVRCGAVRRMQQVPGGREIVFPYEFFNRSRLLIGRVQLTFSLTGPKGFREEKRRVPLLVAPQGRQELSLAFSAEHLGVYRLTPLRAEVCGPIGLVSLRLPAAEASAAAAVPPADRSGAAPGGTSAESAPGGPASAKKESDDYDGAREYLPGDSLHRVHWKLTAHEGKLMTRLFEEESEAFLTVAVDFRAKGEGETALRLHDSLCESAYRAVCRSAADGGRVRLVYRSGERFCEMRVQSEDDLPEAALRLASAETARSAVTADPSALPSSGKVLVLGTEADAELCRPVAACANGGAEVAFLLVLPEKNTIPPPRTWQEMKKSGVACSRVFAGTPRKSGKTGLRLISEPEGM